MARRKVEVERFFHIEEISKGLLITVYDAAIFGVVLSIRRMKDKDAGATPENTGPAGGVRISDAPALRRLAELASGFATEADRKKTEADKSLARAIGKPENSKNTK